MNKRVAKPKRKVPLIPDEAISEAEMERWLRDNHDEISAKLEEARASIRRGDVAPMPPLSELLASARRYHRSRR